jgi:glycosyltransferase involved in cell wall biosynthesis
MIKENPNLIEIVIPCFNEGLAIKDLVEKCNLVSLRAPINFILVDNGSTDNTWEQLKNLTSQTTNIMPIRIVNNIGYGHGILTGIKATKAPYVGWIHADLQTNPEDLIQIVNWLILESSSVNIFIKGRRRNRAPIDVFFSFAMSVFETILFQRKMIEINAQPTLFSRSLIAELNSAPLDFMLDLYVYNSAKKQGYFEKRFFVNFGLRKHGQSSWNKNIFSRLKFIYKTIKYSFMLRIRGL